MSIGERKKELSKLLVVEEHREEMQIMKNAIKQVVKKLIYGPLAPIASIVFRIISNLEYWYFNSKWSKQGRKNQTRMK